MHVHVDGRMDGWMGGWMGNPGCAAPGYRNLGWSPHYFVLQLLQ